VERTPPSFELLKMANVGSGSHPCETERERPGLAHHGHVERDVQVLEVDAVVLPTVLRIERRVTGVDLSPGKSPEAKKGD
jgi:hypothetical protein